MGEFPTVLHALASHAKSNPDKIALIEAETDKKYTYGELWATVKAFSKRLIAAGVKSDFGDGYGTRVVVRCTQDINYVISMLAVHLSGGVFVPVETRIADDRIIEIMKETDSTILIAAKPVSDYECTFIALEESEKEQDYSDNELDFPSLDALAVILFTTGTTGKSKGVMLTYKAYMTRALMIENYGEEIGLIANPLTHTTGLRLICYLLNNSYTAVLIDGFGMPKLFFFAVKKYKVTSFILLAAATKFYLANFRDKLEEISDQITHISFGASTFEKSEIRALKDIFKKARLIQGYGATEVGVLGLDHTNNEYGKYCVGKKGEGLKPGYEVDFIFYDEKREKIIDATKDNPGLIAIKSDTKMLGYWKNPELTASVTRGDYIVLSDLGYKGEDGLCYFLARADDVIITGGYKIAPLEIEEIANSLDCIRESVCVPVPDPISGFVPKLYVVMEKGHDFNYALISNYLRSKLETRKLPRFIEEIDEIPKINNKINRKELRDK